MRKANFKLRSNAKRDFWDQPEQSSYMLRFQLGRAIARVIARNQNLTIREAADIAFNFGIRISLKDRPLRRS